MLEALEQPEKCEFPVSSQPQPGLGYSQLPQMFPALSLRYLFSLPIEGSGSFQYEKH